MGKPRVVVAQIGARHHYAVPRLLEQVGYLEALFTDANAEKGGGRLVAMLPGALKRGALKSISQRKIVGVPRHKIFHTDSLALRQAFNLLKRPGHLPDFIENDHRFDRAVASWDFGNADTLYAMQKHGTRLLKAARSRGLRNVIDVFITPLNFRIVKEEQERFPDIERPSDDESRLELEDDRTRREIENADLLLCPGENVVEGLRVFPEFSGKQYAVVPYGCGINFCGSENRPQKGRILFAGSANLRKGVHYLGMAATHLKKRGYEFRVAGGVDEQMATHPITRNLQFLGRLHRDQMQAEFLSADVFVLPTLAEGCASVVHEAVASGCPVITTRAAGTMVRDMVGGMIVPERDPEALAEAIGKVVQDRAMRRHLAGTCAELAAELTEQRWSERLAKALSMLKCSASSNL